MDSSKDIRPRKCVGRKSGKNVCLFEPPVYRMPVWQADTRIRPFSLSALSTNGPLVSIISFFHTYFSYTSDSLLRDVSFVCSAGERLCVVGPNGSGKTTLLRLAQSQLCPDAGTVTTPVDGSISDRFPFVFESPLPSASVSPPFIAEPLGHAGTHDNAGYDSASPAVAGPSRVVSVGDLLDSTLRHPLGLRRRFDELTTRMSQATVTAKVAAQYDALLSEMEAFDVWTLESRVDAVLAGFGLGHIDRARTLDSLSPGQQARLRLACILLVRPPALVLDEPTNHLDSEARNFLATTMRSWQGPVLFTSHDRAFIDDVATGILDLDVAVWAALARSEGCDPGGGVHRNRGGYSDYLVEKRRARAAHAEIHESQRAEKRKIATHARDSAVVGHAGARSRTEIRMARKFYADRAQKVSSRRINDDARRLEQIARVEVEKPRLESFSISIPPVPRTSRAGKTGTIAVSVRRASVPGRLSPVSFELAVGNHLLVTGTNGSGKSTLLRWIATSAAPTADSTGVVDVAAKRAYVPQDCCEPADLRRQEERPQGKGLIHPRYATTPFSLLSSGNQRRVQLASAFARAPEILLVDEPTNFLDLDFIEALEEAFTAWNGTLIVATHDSWLIERWHGRHIHLQPYGSDAGGRGRR